MNWLSRYVVACTVAVFGVAGARGAEGDRLRATSETPALVTATRPSAAAVSASSRAPALYIRVTAYQPPRDGGAIVVAVSAERAGGIETAIGKFGLSLDRPFAPGESGRAQRFRLPLPSSLAAQEPLRLKIYVLGSRGQGKGASIEIGSAEIR